MKQLLYYSLPLFGNQFKGEVYGMMQFSAKFQIWCRQFGVSDNESLALWVAGDCGETYFGTDERAQEIAKEAYPKLPEQILNVVDVSEQTGGEIRHVSMGITFKP